LRSCLKANEGLSQRTAASRLVPIGTKRGQIRIVWGEDMLILCVSDFGKIGDFYHM
jgi:hypothetical protein